MISDFKIKSDFEMEGVGIISPFYREDERGYFLKDYEKNALNEMGIEGEVSEVFETCSKKNVIRGMHFQTIRPQVKLIRVIRGRIRDVIVDLRADSLTFGQYMAVELSHELFETLVIPRGFAHGFEVMSDEAITLYKCIGDYSKESDTGIRWNDRDVGIDWHTKIPIISRKDSELMTFKEFKELYGGL